MLIAQSSDSKQQFLIEILHDSLTQVAIFWNVIFGFRWKMHVILQWEKDEMSEPRWNVKPKRKGWIWRIRKKNKALQIYYAHQEMCSMVESSVI